MLTSKQHIVLLTPLIVWLAMFQLSSFLPSESRPIIDVETLPTVEAAIFGSAFMYRLVPMSDILVVLSAVPYLFHFAVPWVFSLYLWKAADVKPFMFLWILGVLNLVALLVQLFFPTAPPWYFEKFGAEIPSYDTPSDPARLVRVDQLLRLPLFESMYGENPVVFGSFPSLHAAWPLLIALYSPIHVLGNWKWAYVVWVWWAAIYLKHHYIIDLIGGAVFTGLAVYCTRLVFPQEFINSFMSTRKNGPDQEKKRHLMQ